jgi:hypothetical protein
MIQRTPQDAPHGFRKVRGRHAIERDEVGGERRIGVV